MDKLIYIIIGIFSGVISGMGIGGGAILIPALAIFTDMEQHAAQNINLLYFIPTATIALITHIKNGNVEKKIIPGIVIPGILTSVIGSMIAVNLKADLLRKLFGGFLLIMGVMEIRKKK